MNRGERIAAWTRPALRALKPYYQAPLQGDPLRLDQNTHLLGPNPALAKKDLSQVDVSQYPTRDADPLREALAAKHAASGLTADHFVCANGSDELLDLLTKTFTSAGDTLATPRPSYSLYPFYATLQELRLAEVPLRGGWGLDVDGLIDAEASIVVVASPNNPTGNRFPRGELVRLAEGVDGIVVVDEAYIEYAGPHESLLSSVEAHDNLVVMRTFSKAYGLAGLRIGYLAANLQLAERLRLTKPPYNVNVVSEQIAVAALQEKAWLDDTVATVQAERERLGAALGRLGFRVHPSDANFILTDAPTDPGILLAGLRSRGILARTFPGKPTLEGSIRFTVGGPEHTDALVAVLAEILAEETA